MPETSLHDTDLLASIGIAIVAATCLALVARAARSTVHRRARGDDMESWRQAYGRYALCVLTTPDAAL